MKLTFDRRYDDRWDRIRKDMERCSTCMYDGPLGESCCKHHCGEYSACATCNAQCRNTEKLCEK